METRILGGKEFPLTTTTFLQDLIDSFLKKADSILIEDVSTGSKYTYREIHEKASGVRGALTQLGLKAGDIVTLVTTVTPEAFAFLIGVWLSGAATVCINPLIPIDEIQHLLRRVKSKVIYVGEAFAGKMLEATEGLQQIEAIVSPNGKAPLVDYCDWTSNFQLVTHVSQPDGKDHTIAVYFTSGTTGQPKGVVIRDHSFKFSIHGLMEVQKGNRILLMSPMFWISNALLLNLAILKGCCLILLNAPTVDQILQTINNYKPSYMFSSPSTLTEMTNRKDLEKYDFSSLQSVIIGGSTLHPELKKQIYQMFGKGNVLLQTVYSSTEGLLGTLEMKDFPMDSPQFSTVGQPMDGVTLKIIDTENGNLLGPNCTGEICIKSPAVIKRYLDRELSDEEVDKDGFWHMGDLGFYDEEGCVHFQCRLKEIMKYKNYQIAPAELEAVIQSHPDVLESAVVGKPSPEFGDLPTAFVILRPGSTITEQELCSFVAGKLNILFYYLNLNIIRNMNY